MKWVAERSPPTINALNGQPEVPASVWMRRVLLGGEGQRVSDGTVWLRSAPLLMWLCVVPKWKLWRVKFMIFLRVKAQDQLQIKWSDYCYCQIRPERRKKNIHLWILCAVIFLLSVVTRYYNFSLQIGQIRLNNYMRGYCWQHRRLKKDSSFKHSSNTHTIPMANTAYLNECNTLIIIITILDLTSTSQSMFCALSNIDITTMKSTLSFLAQKWAW